MNNSKNNSNAEKILKRLTSGLLWAAIVIIIDLCAEVFSLKQSAKKITLTGMEFDHHIEPEKIYTVFVPNIRMLFFVLGFMTLWMTFCHVKDKMREKKTANVVSLPNLAKNSKTGSMGNGKTADNAIKNAASENNSDILSDLIA